MNFFVFFSSIQITIPASKLTKNRYPRELLFLVAIVSQLHSLRSIKNFGFVPVVRFNSSFVSDLKKKKFIKKKQKNYVLTTSTVWRPLLIIDQKQ